MVFHLLLNVRERRQLVIQSNERRLHPFDFRVSISDGKLQVLDFFVERVNLSGSARWPGGTGGGLGRRVRRGRGPLLFWRGFHSEDIGI